MYRFTSDPQSEEDAQNPETPPERLWELAWSEPRLMQLVSKNTAVTKSILEEFLQRDVVFWFREFGVDASFVLALHQNIAMNPNTPPELLVYLFEHFPGLEQQANPVSASVSLLEIRRKGELLTKLKEPYISVSLLEEASASSFFEVRLEAANYPGATEDILQKLSDDAQDSVRKAVARHANTTPQILEKLSLDPNIAIRDAVAMHCRVPYATLFALAEQNEAYLCYVALHPETPQERLEELAKDDDLLPLVLRHSNAPQELLMACAEVEALQVLVAQNPSTPLEALQMLPTTTEITRALLDNFTLPADWVEALLTDEDPQIRSKASVHGRAPEAVLHLLKQAGASGDLSHVVTPTEEISRQDLVRLCNRGFFGRLLVASHPKTPELLLQMLWQSASGEILLALANNPALPAFIRDELASDPTAKVRAAIAARCDAALLPRFANDFFTIVRLAVAQRQDLQASVQLGLASDRSLEVRSALVANPSLSAEALQQLSLDTESVIRRLVVDHANISKQTLYSLAQDPQPHISKAAQDKLSPVTTPKIKKSAYLTAPRQQGLEAPTEDLWQIAREVLQKRIARYQKKKR